MDKLLKVDDIMEILDCKRDKALLVMRKMRHININTSETSKRETLRVWESDFTAWLSKSAKEPLEPKKRGRKPKTATAVVSRTGNPYKMPYI